jgi:predicted RNase H-like HicB family nuclease
MAQYSIVIQYSDDDEGYIATMPELPGVSAFGKTPVEAAKEVETAKNAMIEIYNEDGCHLPEPDKLKDFSGQLRIRIPKSLHTSLHFDAKKEGVSLNSYISMLLSRRHELAKVEKYFSNIQSLLISNIFDQSQINTAASGESTEIEYQQSGSNYPGSLQ